MRKFLLLSFTALALTTLSQTGPARLVAQTGGNTLVDLKTYQDLRWRSVGPHRGGRSTAAAGVRTQPNVFYMGATGGGVWKTENSGITWMPISDGQIATGSIGAIDEAPVCSLMNSTFCHVLPPSFVRKTPRSGVGPNGLPTTDAYAMSGFFG